MAQSSASNVTHRSGVLPAGAVAPNFTLHVTPDQTLTLSDLLGRPVILAFYPADWSPVCGDQMALYNEIPVSYTHLDVYKRQLVLVRRAPMAARLLFVPPSLSQSNRPTPPLIRFDDVTLVWRGLMRHGQAALPAESSSTGRDRRGTCLAHGQETRK